MISQTVIVCPKCSHALQPSTSKCLYCGARLREDEDGVTRAPEEIDAEQKAVAEYFSSHDLQITEQQDEQLHPTALLPTRLDVLYLAALPFEALVFATGWLFQKATWVAFIIFAFTSGTIWWEYRGLGDLLIWVALVVYLIVGAIAGGLITELDFATRLAQPRKYLCARIGVGLWAAFHLLAVIGLFFGKFLQLPAKLYLTVLWIPNWLFVAIFVVSLAAVIARAKQAAGESA